MKPVSDTRLDKYWREIVKADGECLFAGMDGITCSGRMEAMHILSRGWKRIRWDLDNGVCGCSAHHKFYTMHPKRWADVIEEIYPGRWEILDVKRLPTLKKIDKLEILSLLKSRAEIVGVAA